MHRGDTGKIVFNYMCNGHDIYEGELDEIELQLGKENIPGSIKCLLTTGKIEWDDESEKYVTYISQKETFNLPTVLIKTPHSTGSKPKVPYQVRFFLDGCCVGDDIGYLTFKRTLSETILGQDEDQVNSISSYSLNGTVSNRDIVITGQITITPGSSGRKPVWGEILGDINNQTDLINILNTKEKNDTQKIIEFFETHEEFDYRFLISIANKPIAEVAEFVELIINEYVQHAPVAMVPYDVGKMCLILKVNSDPMLGETFRCLIPSTGQILSVSMVDASGLVKFAYHFIGDEGETAKWGLITGNIDDQEDLNESFVDSDSYITKTEIDDLFS